MRIGDLAKAAGVHVQTIRFYERRRLLPPPARSSGGYREYSSDTVRLVQFIRQVQTYGYALEEIRELLALGQGPHVPKTVRDRAQKKLQQIEAEIGRLCGIRDALTQLLQEVDRGATPPGCLVLQGPNNGVTQTSQASSTYESLSGSRLLMVSTYTADALRLTFRTSRGITLPSDVFFEVTGVLQFFAAIVAARASFGLCRGRSAHV